MHKITIDFKDLNDRDCTEDFYFDLNEEELIALEIERGGLAEYWQRIIDSNDGHTVYSEFKQVLELSYGQKSDDGRRFLKNEETRSYLRSHVAFSKLIIGLITNNDAAAAFMNNLIPAAADMQILVDSAKAGKQPTDRLRQKDRPVPGTRIIEEPDLPRAVETASVGEELAPTEEDYTFDKELFDYTPAEMQEWSPERLHAWKQRLAAKTQGQD